MAKYPPDQWTPYIHYALAGAHAAKLSYGFPEGVPESGGSQPLPPLAVQQQRRAAIDNFETFIAAMPNTPDAVFAWQEAWRLLSDLPPSQVHFGCGCE